MAAPDSHSLRSHRELSAAVFVELHRQSVLAMGRTAPNPPVAALVVGTDPGGVPTILAAGHTEIAGGRHAEVVALDTLDQSAQQGAGVRRFYVTLEPCSHHGRTPPCTERIQKAIIKHGGPRRLIVCTRDATLPTSGIAKLRADGLRTSLPGDVRARSFRAAYLEGFLSRGAGRGPRLHFKAALSADGLIGLSDRRVGISNAAALRVGQLLRAKLDAVVVGPGTTAIDRPSLGLRLPAVSPADAPIFSARSLAAGDPLLDAIFRFEGEIQARAAAEPEAYQPERVLLLGRPFAGAAEYLREQLAPEAPLRPAKLAFVGREQAAEWRALLPQIAQSSAASEPGVLPALSDAAFGRELRAWLGELGLNEVLVEGGAGLVRALKDDARVTDRIALLRSPRKMAELAGADYIPANAVAVPDWLLQSSLSARYDLAGDTLEIRQPG